MGGHTLGSQLVLIEVGGGGASDVICLAGDAAYLYRNILEKICIGQMSCSSLFENRMTVQDLKELHDHGAVVVPGHDTRMLEVFPEISKGTGIYRIFSTSSNKDKTNEPPQRSKASKRRNGM